MQIVNETEIKIPGLKSAVRTSRRGGFTLFELIVVIFLISLMLVLSIPSFTFIGEHKIQSEAKKLASILRYLNDSSVSLKKTFKLKVDFREKSLNFNGPDCEKEMFLDNINAVDLQSKGLVTEGDITIFFGPLGVSEALSFILSNNKRVMTVSLNPLSGRVKILSSKL